MYFLGLNAWMIKFPQKCTFFLAKVVLLVGFFKKTCKMVNFGSILRVMDHPDVILNGQCLRSLPSRLSDIFGFSFQPIRRLWACIIGWFFQENLWNGQFWPYFGALEYARDPPSCSILQVRNPWSPQRNTMSTRADKNSFGGCHDWNIPQKMDFLPNWAIFSPSRPP